MQECASQTYTVEVPGTMDSIPVEFRMSVTVPHPHHKIVDTAVKGRMTEAANVPLSAIGIVHNGDFVLRSSRDGI